MLLTWLAAGLSSLAVAQEQGLQARVRPDWKIESDQAEAELGRSVGTAGDVNGDGYDEVVVGAPQYSHGQKWDGAAVVFLGRATVAPPRP